VLWSLVMCGLYVNTFLFVSCNMHFIYFLCVALMKMFILFMIFMCVCVCVCECVCVLNRFMRLLSACRVWANEVSAG
jgi:hypothetical protein